MTKANGSFPLITECDAFCVQLDALCEEADTTDINSNSAVLEANRLAGGREKEAAIQQFRGLQEQYPDSGNICALHAQALWMAGRTEDAVALAETHFLEVRSKSQVAAGLGQIHLRERHFAQCVSWYARAVALESQVKTPGFTAIYLGALYSGAAAVQSRPELETTARWLLRNAQYSLDDTARQHVLTMAQAECTRDVAEAMLTVARWYSWGTPVKRHSAAPTQTRQAAGGQDRPSLILLALVAAYAALVLFAGLARLPLFGRDESLYAEAAREMYASGDWVLPRVNGVPFLEKPPLYYWLAAASYRAFGVSPLAARLPAALFALATVVLVAWIGMRVWGRRAGVLAGLVLTSSLLLAVVGRLGIMDAPLTFFTAAALVVYVRWRRRGTARYAAAFGVLVGLAVLLKSLAGFLPALIVLVHVVAFRRPRLHPWALPAVVAILCAAVIAVPWFVAVGARDPSFWATFARENFSRMGQAMQGHAGGPLYYVGVILLGFFPWVVFLPAAFRRGLGAGETKHRWRSLCVMWFAVVLVFFTLLSTKLPGYVTPLFPAMALLVGRELDRRLEERGRAVWVATVIAALLLAAVIGIGVPALAARLAAKVEAAGQVRDLLPAVYAWAAAFALIALGAASGWRGRPAIGLAAMIVAQTAALAVVLLWIMPMLVPYMEGSRESRLAEIAQRELPGAPVVLYNTRPEAVAFALGSEVRVLKGSDEWSSQISTVIDLPDRKTALITPGGRKRPAFVSSLTVRRTWTVGNRQLSEIAGADRQP